MIKTGLRLGPLRGSPGSPKMCAKLVRSIPQFHPKELFINRGPSKQRKDKKDCFFCAPDEGSGLFRLDGDFEDCAAYSADRGRCFYLERGVTLEL